MTNLAAEGQDSASLEARLHGLLQKVTDLVAGREVDLLAGLDVGDDLDSLAFAIHLLKSAASAAPPPRALAPQAIELFHAAPWGVAVVDRDARLVEVNDAWARMVGQVRDDLVGRPVGTGWDDAAELEGLVDHLAGSASGPNPPQRRLQITRHVAAALVGGWRLPGKGTYGVIALADATTHGYEAEGRPAPEHSAAVVVPAPSEARPLHVLVVDDDASVRSVTSELLEACGFRATVLGGAAEVMTWFEQRHDAPDVLLVDLSMPRVTGPQLVERLGDRILGIPVVYMTGYLDPDPGHVLAADRTARLLRKPFSLTDLVGVLHDAVGATGVRHP